MKRDRAERDLRLNRLMRAKLGRLFDWSAPKIEDTVGPFDPTPFEKFDAQRRKLVTRCADWLSELSDEQIVALSEPAEDNDDDDPSLEEWMFLCGREIAELMRREPPWYAGGFGHPDYQADFEHWCKMPRFSVSEALSLSVGVEPRHIEADWLRQLAEDDMTKLWPTLQFLLRQYDLLKRWFDPHRKNWKVAPKEFLYFSNRVDCPAHPEFTRLLREYHLPDEVPKREKTQRIDKREFDTMAKLFSALAIREYGYDPTHAKSPIPKEITDMMAELGLTISTETVRTYLRRGAKFLPEDWKPK